jgi:hypothetical protein
MTMEIVQSSTDLRLSPYVISFLADNIILLRYIEIAGELAKGLRVIKMRNSNHSNDLCQYEITSQGMIVRESLIGDSGTNTGTVVSPMASGRVFYSGLTKQETLVLQALIELHEASVQALARRIGLPEGLILNAILDRLISLNYATMRHDTTGPIYWPVAQALVR